MEHAFLDTILSGFESLYSTSILLVVLMVLSLWVWTLICYVTFNFRISINKNSVFLATYSEFCLELAKRKPPKKLFTKWVKTQAEDIVQPFANHVRTILLLAALAPLLGLLGTVDGMIDTFYALSAVKTEASNAQLSDGISKALATTQYGLLVAIPALLAGGILYRKTQKLRNTLRSIALHAMEEESRTKTHTHEHSIKKEGEQI